MKSFTPNFPFVGSYQTYKKNTDDIARFLDEAAVTLGYKISAADATDASQNAPEKPKPKPKKKKGKRKNTNNKKQDDDGEKNKEKHRIRIPEFVRIASAIRYAPPPPVSLPDWLMPALESTVQLRKNAAVLYKALGDGTEEDDKLKTSNTKHDYFINVLETVRDLLAPLGEKTAKMVARVTVKPGGKKQPTVEEEEEEPEVSEIAEAVEKLNVAEEEADLEPPLPPPGLEDDFDDEEWDEELEENYLIFVAVYCLFQDLNTIREYLSEVWEQYKNNCEDGTDLMTASMVTNTALDLVRRMEDDLIKEFPNCDYGPHLSKHHFEFICSLKGMEPDDLEQPGDPYNFRMHKIADWLFYGVAMEVEAFYEKLPFTEAGAIFARRNEPDKPRYDPTADRNAMDVRQKWREDKLILEDVLPEFSQLVFPATIFQNYKDLWLDEWSEGVIKTLDESIIPLWVVFGAQVFLDINHILRERVKEGYEQLRTTAVSAKVDLAIALKGLKPIPNWPAREIRGMEGMMKHIDHYILRDPIMDVKKDIDKEKPEAKAGDMDESFYLMKHHPLLAGTTRFFLTLLHRKGGTNQANAWASIIHTAHLYNALRESGELEVPWPDMDRLIEIHTEEAIFRGKRPRSKLACEERYMKLYDLQANGVRLDWDKMSAIIQTFGERYFLHDRVTWTVDNVEKILRGGRKGKNRQSARDGVSVVVLLRALRDVLSEEVPKLRFPYLSMHRRCMRLMHELRDLILVDFRDLHKCVHNANLVDDEYVASAAGWVIEFGGLVDSGKDARMLKWVGGYRNLVFVAAAELMAKFIEKEGSVEINKVEKGI